MKPDINSVEVSSIASIWWMLKLVGAGSLRLSLACYKRHHQQVGGGGGVCGHELAKQGDLCNGPSGFITNSQIPTTPNPIYRYHLHTPHHHHHHPIHSLSLQQQQTADPDNTNKKVVQHIVYTRYLKRLLLYQLPSHLSIPLSLSLSPFSSCLLALAL